MTTGFTFYRKKGFKFSVVGFLLLSLCSPIVNSIPASGLVGSSEFVLTNQDVAFILKQINIAEAHATKEAVGAGAGLGVVVPPTSSLGTGVNDIPTANLGYGLRQVDGRNNNITSGSSVWSGSTYPSDPGQSSAGAADTLFPRITTPVFKAPYDVQGTNISDSNPRVISNLISDMTPKAPVSGSPYSGTLYNPVAMSVSGKTIPVSGSGGFGYGSVEILNTAPNNIILPPYSSMFTFFGQFFDHGLDLVGKGSTFVALPIPTGVGDPLQGTGSMHLSRTVYPAGSNIQVTAGNNSTTPWIDQNQSYASHPSKQVFIREYTQTGGKPSATGNLLSATAHSAVGVGAWGIGFPALPEVAPTAGNIGTWRDVKEQARNILGIQLRDADISNVPLVLTDEYGRFLPGPNGFPQMITTTQLGGCVAVTNSANFVCEGNTTTPISTSTAVRTGHAFVNDINFFAGPSGTADIDTTTGNQNQTMSGGTLTSYDNELLDAHFVTGDGRGNENIGLTAIHTVFHAEHQRLIADLNTIISANTTLNSGFNAPGWSRGERLFLAARLINEMEYQHLVFDTFARRIDPSIRAFAGYNPSLDPNITAEFANAVYRFGHSMLNEQIARTSVSGADLSTSLFAGFLNPIAFNNVGVLSMTGSEAAGSIARGSSLQVGNEIDEFITGALRNNLVGEPLDLASLNLARGRDTGMPPLNNVRAQLFTKTSDPTLTPYTSWDNFGTHMRHPESLVNFVAAYGTHGSITNASTLKDKRCVAYAIVNGVNPGTQSPIWGDCPSTPVPSDAATFMSSPATTSGLNDVDLWIGGLAESRGTTGPSMLGTTFAYIFRTQMENLQDSDRFYYLSRLAGTNLLNQINNNTLADIFVRNTDAASLPADMFSAPGLIVDLSKTLPSGVSDSSGTTTYVGPLHTVFVGTTGADRMKGGTGEDTMRGFDGNDTIDGFDGSDNLQGGAGNDVLIDTGISGGDIASGGSGNDYISTGSGPDVNDGGEGADTVQAGGTGITASMGAGNDIGAGAQGPDSFIGDEGDDWLDGGDGSDVLVGDQVPPALGIDLVVPGNDVLIGGGGIDSYAGAGGIDIISDGDATSVAQQDLMSGGQGFDWVTYANDPYNATNPTTLKNVDADLALSAAAVGDPRTAVMDLFPDGDVEGLSGGSGNDILSGDARTSLVAATGINDQLPVADTTITNLVQLLVPGVADGRSGNIILGGAGSDIINGRQGNDLIDGDAYLTTSIGGCNVNGLAALLPLIASGTISNSCTAANTVITRSIILGVQAGTDVAVFSGTRSQYTITSVAASGSVLGYFLVVGPDGSDVVRNIEIFRFTDPINGTSVDVAVSAILLPTVAPSIPLNVKVTSGDKSASVTWNIPSTTGGGQINYTVTAWTTLTKGKKVGTGCTAISGLTCLITGLVNGTAYYIDMFASNSVGNSPVTSPRIQVIPAVITQAPSVPLNPAATGGDTVATITWSAPLSAGSPGSTITSYVAQLFDTQGQPVQNCQPSTTYCQISGLTNGIAYGVEVRAINNSGAISAPTSRIYVTPAAIVTKPSVVQNVSVSSIPGSLSATVSWLPPLSTGGSGQTISTYTSNVWSALTGGTLVTSCATSSTSCTVTSLVNGTTYYIDVVATNSPGNLTSDPSSPRVTVTPTAIAVTPVAPSVPLNVTAAKAVTGSGITVTWTQSTSDGGSPILRYEARAFAKVTGGKQIGFCTFNVTGVLPLSYTCTISSGLVAGQSYYVEVVAINAVGTGPASTPRRQAISA